MQPGKNVRTTAAEREQAAPTVRIRVVPAPPSVRPSVRPSVPAFWDLERKGQLIGKRLLPFAWETLGVASRPGAAPPLDRGSGEARREVCRDGRGNRQV